MLSRRSGRSVRRRAGRLQLPAAVRAEVNESVPISGFWWCHGEVEVRGDNISGIAANLAQRVESLAGPGQVLVSRTVVDLVAGSDITFVDTGDHELKGIDGNWRLFAVATS